MTTDTSDDRREYLEDIEDGAGCVGVWEALSDARDEHEPCESCGMWRGLPTPHDEIDHDWLCRECQERVVPPKWPDNPE